MLSLAASLCSAWRWMRLGVIMSPGLLFVNLVTPWRVLKCLSCSSVWVDFIGMILLCLAAWTVMECQYLPYNFLLVRDLIFPITSFKIILCKKAWLWRRRTNFGERKLLASTRVYWAQWEESSNVCILGLTFPLYLITTVEPQDNKLHIANKFCQSHSLSLYWDPTV